MESKFKIDFPRLSRIKIFDGRSIIEVNKKSPVVLRKSVELSARYFLREGYSDLLHYGLHNDDAIAFLFCDYDLPHAIGACCFRFRSYTDITQRFWRMHWAWIHPFARNKGLLSTHVELFNERFGYWYPEKPHSKAMNRFIEKHNLIDPLKKFQVK